MNSQKNQSVQKEHGVKINITGNGMFWLFAIAYLCLDTFLFVQGFNTFFWNYKTPEEKQIQQIKIEKMKNADGITASSMAKTQEK